MLSDHLLMFSRWLACPTEVGAVSPSAGRLARAMVSAAITDPRDTVVEFGSGTGAITRALLETGVSPQNLVLVERNTEFHKLLVSRFPEVRIILGDATNTDALVENVGACKITAMVSALPLLVMNREEIRAVLRTVASLLSIKGVFAQYTYSRRPPIPEDLLRDFRFESEMLDRVWLNLPPATVWRYRRRSAAIPEFANSPSADTARRDESVRELGD